MKNLKSKISSVSISVIVVFASMFLAIGNVEANTSLEGVSPTLIEAGMDGRNNNAKVESPIQGGGTLDKAEGYVDDKLGDVVGFLQSFIKPFTYVMFIISAITILVGVVSGSKQKFAGLLGMTFSILVYVTVTFAPEIVNYFSAWLSI